jgi:pimeloyl-ACP methyl ester carboxylesterase
MPSYVETRIPVNGADTAVRTTGEGEPLVYFHGGGIVEGADCFLPLAERFRLVAPYTPGFGTSDSDPSIDGVEAWVERYVQVLDQLGIADFVLLGHSLGGWLAARFALAHGARVRRLVLASPFGLDTPDHHVANLGALAPEDVYGVLTRDDSIWEGRLPSQLTDDFLADRAREGQFIGQVVKAPFDPGLDELLPNLATPTMLVWGDDDRVVPIEHMPLWEAAISGVASRTYPDRGHLLFWEDPQSVQDAGDFLAAG